MADSLIEALRQQLPEAVVRRQQQDEGTTLRGRQRPDPVDVPENVPDPRVFINQAQQFPDAQIGQLEENETLDDVINQAEGDPDRTRQLLQDRGFDPEDPPQQTPFLIPKGRPQQQTIEEPEIVETPEPQPRPSPSPVQPEPAEDLQVRENEFDPFFETLSQASGTDVELELPRPSAEQSDEEFETETNNFLSSLFQLIGAISAPQQFQELKTELQREERIERQQERRIDLQEEGVQLRRLEVFNEFQKQQLESFQQQKERQIEALQAGRERWQELQDRPEIRNLIEENPDRARRMKLRVLGDSFNSAGVSPPQDLSENVDLSFEKMVLNEQKKMAQSRAAQFVSQLEEGMTQQQFQENLDDMGADLRKAGFASSVVDNALQKARQARERIGLKAQEQEATLRNRIAEALTNPDDELIQGILSQREEITPSIAESFNTTPERLVETLEASVDRRRTAQRNEVSATRQQLVIDEAPSRVVDGIGSQIFKRAGRVANEQMLTDTQEDNLTGDADAVAEAAQNNIRNLAEQIRMSPNQIRMRVARDFGQTRAEGGTVEPGQASVVLQPILEAHEAWLSHLIRDKGDGDISKLIRRAAQDPSLANSVPPDFAANVEVMHHLQNQSSTPQDFIKRVLNKRVIRNQLNNPPIQAALVNQLQQYDSTLELLDRMNRKQVQSFLNGDEESPGFIQDIRTLDSSASRSEINALWEQHIKRATRSPSATDRISDALRFFRNSIRNLIGTEE